MGLTDMLHEGFFPKGGISTILLGFLSISGLFSTLTWIYDWFVSRFTVSVTINQQDESWTWLGEWLEVQQPLRNAHDVTLETEQKDGGEDDSWELRYMPAVGAQVAISYKGRKIWLERFKEKEAQNIWSSRSHDNLKLSTVSGSLEPLKDLINDAMRVNRERTKGMTKIYFPDSNGNGWSRPRTRPSRPLTSVVLGSIKDEIVGDATEFLSSREWYAQRGLPYRRGYLLYGPPGCGKSSFIFALAGHLGLSICVLNLSQPGMTDNNLQTLMDDIPTRSILLLEDVDAAFGSRFKPGEAVGEKKEGDDPKAAGSKEGANSLAGPESRTTVSFSGLLNALDGVAASEGRVLFLTTNHIEKLDPALIRPGRVDMRGFFGLADKAQLRGLFLQFYPKENELASQFAAQAPPDKFSLAALQGHFLSNKKDPKAAVASAAQLFAEKPAVRFDVPPGAHEAKPQSDAASLRLWRKKSL